ncbi:MAG: phosphoribosylformylglycinamidine cyclo-ligase [Dehalococcoidia bacterium]
MTAILNVLDKSGVGPLASLFALAGYKDPVIAASVDSVGTKLRLAILAGKYRGVGIDIVNHCVNDVLTSGARPLFFLDYIGSSKLSDTAKLELIEGMVEACSEAGCVLIGGETADMPDIYAAGDFDLVGFLIGACERGQVIDASRVAAGDVLIGLPSDGLHTNGYTLVRRIFRIGVGGTAAADRRILDRHYGELGETLVEALLRPHRSYLADIVPMLLGVKAMAHITGGGIAGNLARVIREGLSARVDTTSWETPPLFQFIARQGRVDAAEMFRVFNMGIGMIVVVSPEKADELLGALPGAVRVGSVEAGEPRVRLDPEP